jgi:hypothetical protein
LPPETTPHENETPALSALLVSVVSAVNFFGRERVERLRDWEDGGGGGCGVTELLIVAPTCEPYEYWCDNCRQLRLCLSGSVTGCGNCGAPIVLRGQPGELDADKLRGTA